MQLLGREFALGPQMLLVPGNTPQGYSPWVLLKGRTAQLPCAFCFSGAHRLGLETDPESLTLQVHLISKCTECKWGLLCCNCTGRAQLGKCFPALTAARLHLHIQFYVSVEQFKGKKKVYLEKRTMEKIQFFAFFLLLAKQIRENMVIQRN